MKYYKGVLGKLGSRIPGFCILVPGFWWLDVGGSFGCPVFLVNFAVFIVRNSVSQSLLSSFTLDHVILSFIWARWDFSTDGLPTKISTCNFPFWVDGPETSNLLSHSLKCNSKERLFFLSRFSFLLLGYFNVLFKCCLAGCWGWKLFFCSRSAGSSVASECLMNLWKMGFIFDFICCLFGRYFSIEVITLANHYLYLKFIYFTFKNKLRFC